MTAIFTVRANSSRLSNWRKCWLLLFIQATFLVGQPGHLWAEESPFEARPPVLLVVPDKDAPYSGFLDGFSRCNESLDKEPSIYRVMTIDQVVAELPVFDSHRVVGVGTTATEFLYGHPDTPRFSSALVPAIPVDRLLAEDADHRSGGIDTVFVLDQPIKRRLALIRSLLPKASTLSVVFGPDSALREEELRREAKGYDFALKVATVESGNELPPAMKALLSNSDALLLLYDPVLTSSSSIRFLLYSAYQSRVPVVGYSEGYVRAGAIAAAYSSPEALGCQVAEHFLQQTLSGPTSPVQTRPAFIDPSYYQYRLNETVAQSLGVTTDRVPPGNPVPEGER